MTFEEAFIKVSRGRKTFPSMVKADYSVLFFVTFGAFFPKKIGFV